MENRSKFFLCNIDMLFIKAVSEGSQARDECF